jgi:Rieske Fe-S protein
LAALVAAGARADTLASVRVVLVDAAGAQGSERSYPIPSADGVSIDQQNQVIIVRYANHVFAFSLACPHENTALRWRPEDQRFQCPRHQSKYQPDGAFISGRATRNMDRFAVRRDGNNMIVELAKLYRSDQQSAEWTAAVVTM